jgi:hypothetical protein
MNGTGNFCLLLVFVALTSWFDKAFYRLQEFANYCFGNFLRKVLNFFL